MRERSSLPSGRLAAVAVGLLACCLLAGCNEDPGADNGKADEKPSPLHSGCIAAYPFPPFGVAAGSTIECLEFQGFADAKASSTTLGPIDLADFYNPHVDDPTYQPSSPAVDDRLYPPGSAYGAGEKKPRAILIDIASVWCGPCNEEAKSLLPSLHAKYKPCGGEFVFQLAEGGSPGSPATETLLRAWTSKYKVDYPATIDPGRQLSAIVSSASFPDGIMIDTRTMKIAEAIAGVPDDAFWHTFESLLEPGCLK